MREKERTLRIREIERQRNREKRSTVIDGIKRDKEKEKENF